MRLTDTVIQRGWILTEEIVDADDDRDEEGQKGYGDALPGGHQHHAEGQGQEYGDRQNFEA